jgi:ABC-type glycerol-3-phosphate transport system permease component
MAVTVDALAIDIQEIGRREQRLRKRNYGIVAIAGILCLIWIVPFYYVAVSIFKTAAEYAQSPPLSLPASLSPFLDNVIVAWTSAKLGNGILNSAIYGLVGSGLAVFFAAMAAYGLSRMNFSGKSFWFMLIFSGTVFPFQMYLIPLFFGYQQFGILNSRTGMILFYTAICTPFPTLVLKNYMSQISPEIDEAARMDGAREFRIFLSIILPNCVGPMVALFLLQFTWIWNDLLFSSVLGNREEIRSVMNSLQVFQGNYVTTGPNVALTASLLASVPCLLIFLALRKRFMAGLQVLT